LCNRNRCGVLGATGCRDRTICGKNDLFLVEHRKYPQPHPARFDGRFCNNLRVWMKLYQIEPSRSSRR